MSPATDLIVFAQRYDDWGDHHDDGDWIVMGVGMLVFWALVIVLVVWLVRTLSHGHHPGAAHTVGLPESPLEVLDRRLADGAISIGDYEERRRILRGGGT